MGSLVQITAKMMKNASTLFPNFPYTQPGLGKRSVVAVCILNPVSQILYS